MHGATLLATCPHVIAWANGAPTTMHITTMHATLSATEIAMIEFAVLQQRNHLCICLFFFFELAEVL